MNPYIFPHPEVSERNGMTLRDYFAGQALIGLLFNPEDGNFRLLAEDAYLYADAMLLQRIEP
jgi:hypothetical protein